MDEIRDMTLPQIEMYSRAGARYERKKLAAFTVGVAMGSRGEEKSYKKFVSSLEST